ncbi:MAG TPA: ABC transporter ATP-binding protein [archaeon]|nr:ABC transporter ATP-binding protein [archaeon]
MKPIISLRKVSKTYRMGEVNVSALKGVSLDVEKGEFLAISGPSGSGKSTIMNLVGCLDLASEGEIFLDGKNIETLSESNLAQIRGQKIGFVFQQFNLLPTLTTLENIMLPMEFQDTADSKARKRAAELLDLVGLKDRAGHLPTQLSGGQMQRVAIARALAVDPEIILADEPTGNLDSKTGQFIIDFLIRIHRKDSKTIIMVTHDMNLAKHAGRIVYLKDGQIERIEQKKGGVRT